MKQAWPSTPVYETPRLPRLWWSWPWSAVVRLRAAVTALELRAQLDADIARTAERRLDDLIEGSARLSAMVRILQRRIDGQTK